MPDPREQRWQLLKARLLEQARRLKRQGILVQKKIKGRSYWYVRFYGVKQCGRRVQHSVYVGADLDLVKKARRLLRDLREQEQEFQALIKLKRVLRGLAAFLPGLAQRPGWRAG